MDFGLTFAGSVRGYVKTLEKQTAWKLKQQSGDYSAHKESLDQWLPGSREEQSKPKSAIAQWAEENETDWKLASIRNRLANGKKLTGPELDYLRQKDEQAYYKAKAIERERAGFERALKRCRTREEVQRLRLSHLAASLAAVKSVEHNARIPEGCKLALAGQEKGRVDALGRVFVEFVRRGDYARLPTEAEERRARRGNGKKRRIVTVGGSGFGGSPVETERPVPLEGFLDSVRAHREAMAERTAMAGRLEPGKDASANGDVSKGADESDEAKTFRAMQEARAAGEEAPPPSDRLIERYKRACIK